MITTTTHTVEGYEIENYLGIVSGETVNGVNAIKDLGAGVRNILGGRSAGYESELNSSKQDALQEMSERAAQIGAHAVIGISFDMATTGTTNMILVSCTGTAVTLRQK